MSEKLDALLREHAKKYNDAVLGADNAAELTAGSAGSLYYQDLAARAERRGCTVEEVRARDQELLASGEFPSANCLRPGEVLRAVLKNPGLPEARWRHYDRCLFCQALVARSQVDEHTKTDVVRKLAALATTDWEPAGPLVHPKLEPAWSSWSHLFGAAWGYVVHGWALATVLPIVLLCVSQPARDMAANFILVHGKAASSNADLWLAAALQSSAKGDDSTVIALTTNVLHANPDNPAALWLRGLASLNQGDRHQAEADFGSLCEADPTNVYAIDMYESIKDNLFMHPGDVNRLFADGSVRFNKDTVDGAIFRRAMKNLGSVPQSQVTDGTSNTAVFSESMINGGSMLPSQSEWAAGDRSIGTDRPDLVVSPLSDLARSLLRRSHSRDAERVLRHAVAIYEKTQIDDWRRYDVASLLGAALVAQHRYAEAEPLIVAAYDGIRDRKAKIETQKWPFVLDEAAQNAIRLYESWGKPAQAAAWKAKLETRDLPSDVFTPPPREDVRANQ